VSCAVLRYLDRPYGYTICPFPSSWSCKIWWRWARRPPKYRYKKNIINKIKRHERKLTWWSRNLVNKHHVIKADRSPTSKMYMNYDINKFPRRHLLYTNLKRRNRFEHELTFLLRQQGFSTHNHTMCGKYSWCIPRISPWCIPLGSWTRILTYLVMRINFRFSFKSRGHLCVVVLHIFVSNFVQIFASSRLYTLYN